jgi:hypothetical protein
MGRLGLQKVTQSLEGESLDEVAKRLRRRFGREDK